MVPFVGASRESAILSARRPPDPRVIHYWDHDAVTSEWFAEKVVHSPSPAWDVYFLYGPEAESSSLP